MEASDRNSERNHEYHDYPAFYIELFIQVTIPIRRMFPPAIIQTVPAMISKICLLTPYFIVY